MYCSFHVYNTNTHWLTMCSNAPDVILLLCRMPDDFTCQGVRVWQLNLLTFSICEFLLLIHWLAMRPTLFVNCTVYSITCGLGNLAMVESVSAFMVYHASVGDKLLLDHFNFGESCPSNFLCKWLCLTPKKQANQSASNHCPICKCSISLT
jgi:hypothetical protein